MHAFAVMGSTSHKRDYVNYMHRLVFQNSGRLRKVMSPSFDDQRPDETSPIEALYARIARDTD